MGRVKEINEVIKSEWKNVQQQWQVVRNEWKDGNCRKFEKEYWQVFNSTIQPALNEFDKIDLLISKAKQEVK